MESKSVMNKIFVFLVTTGIVKFLIHNLFVCIWPYLFYIFVMQMLLSIIIGWLVSLIITEAGGFTDDPTAKEYNSRTDARLDAISNSKWFFFPYPGSLS